ncbi:MAG TPA: hypothetical protein VGN86_05020 [Pyrinomonadaceae bacterium]|jgi:hypothetical protein|nr:hypothetical protein [Pyrinomonadaceae bacterium]
MRIGNKSKSVRATSLCLALTLCLLAAVTATRVGKTASTSSIAVTNSSTLEIRHLYLSPTNQDNWGPDQLDGSTIAPNGSFTINNVSCDQGSIKVIAEDQNGCFFYKTVDCSSNSSWTIASDATPDCGTQ